MQEMLCGFSMSFFNRCLELAHYFLVKFRLRQLGLRLILNYVKTMEAGIFHGPIFTETPVCWSAKPLVGHHYYVACNEDIFILLFVETLRIYLILLVISVRI